jgi:hypothetical protein
MARIEMESTPERVKAQLRWALACERLSFVLDPPSTAAPEAAVPDVNAAIEQALAALDELRAAFCSKDA